ncbi:hypothetical protein [Sulfitobacter sp. 1A15106]|uniref:hypothetical protein n=1 Tax=Sulfitobacter sp. 1A15106 TaxID=3368590 RepID=UPI003747307E
MPFALIDPNWGAPVPIASTIRDTEEAAWVAACRCKEAALYSGASQYPLPHGSAGTREALIGYGFCVAPVRIEIDQAG